MASLSEVSSVNDNSAKTVLYFFLLMEQMG